MKKSNYDPRMKWIFKLNRDMRRSEVLLYIGGKKWNIPVKYVKCEQSMDEFLEGEIRIFIHKGNCEFEIGKSE